MNRKLLGGEGPAPTSALKEKRQYAWKNIRPPALLPEAKDSIGRFLENWLVKQDIPAALQFLDLDALATQEFVTCEALRFASVRPGRPSDSTRTKTVCFLFSPGLEMRDFYNYCRPAAVSRRLQK